MSGRRIASPSFYIARVVLTKLWVMAAPAGRLGPDCAASVGGQLALRLRSCCLRRPAHVSFIVAQLGADTDPLPVIARPALSWVARVIPAVLFILRRRVRNLDRLRRRERYARIVAQRAKLDVDMKCTPAGGQV
jgi:hypothetical protein